MELLNDQGHEFFILPRSDLIASKRAADRDVDRDDVRFLELIDEPDEPADLPGL